MKKHWPRINTEMKQSKEIHWPRTNTELHGNEELSILTAKTQRAQSKTRNPNLSTAS